MVATKEGEVKQVTAQPDQLLSSMFSDWAFSTVAKWPGNGTTAPNAALRGRTSRLTANGNSRSGHSALEDHSVFRGSGFRTVGLPGATAPRY